MPPHTRLSTRDMCFIAFFAAIIAICAQISFPLPSGVPLTLQTFAVLLAGIVLGPKKGALAVIVYILLGAAGIPVFTQFRGGINVIAGPTGGFILSFPIMAFAAGIGAGKNSVIGLASGLTGGVAINFFSGMLFFSFIMSAGLRTAFAATVLPFIPGAVIEIVLLTVTGGRIVTTLKRLLQ